MYSNFSYGGVYRGIYSQKLCFTAKPESHEQHIPMTLTNHERHCSWNGVSAVYRRIFDVIQLNGRVTFSRALQF